MAIRKLKARPIVPPPDTYFLTKSQLAGALGWSMYTLTDRLPYWWIYRLPEPVRFGNTLRFRIDELPSSGYKGTWLDRFRAKQRIDFAVPAKQITRGATA